MDRAEISRKADNLSRQCDTCILGNKKIGIKSGCDIKRQLVIKKFDTSWERSDTFLNQDGTCKLYQSKYAG